MNGCYLLNLTTRARGVNYITILMLAVAILFMIPTIIYIFEGGYGIAILPTILMIISVIITIGLYLLKKYAWFAAIIIGILGTVIFIADSFNLNIESVAGAISCILLLVGLIWIRKYYY